MPKSTSFTLSDDLNAFIEHEVAENNYSTASEVVRDALRRLRRRRERDAYEARLVDEGDTSGLAAASHADVWTHLDGVNARSHAAE